jgi:hypothetical protein
MKQYFLIIITVLSLCLGVSVIAAKQRYYMVVSKGMDIALDTVNVLMRKQLRSDTTITELEMAIQNGKHIDTVRYFLSRKTLIK